MTTDEQIDRLLIYFYDYQIVKKKRGIVFDVLCLATLPELNQPQRDSLFHTLLNKKYIYILKRRKGENAVKSVIKMRAKAINIIHDYTSYLNYKESFNNGNTKIIKKIDNSINNSTITNSNTAHGSHLSRSLIHNTTIDNTPSKYDKAQQAINNPSLSILMKFVYYLIIPIIVIAIGLYIEYKTGWFTPKP